MMEGNVWQIVALSLRVAGIAIVVALPIAFLVAWILARFNFPGKSLVQAIVTMPLVLPPVVTGYLLLILFGSRGALGAPLQEWLGLFLFLPLDWCSSRCWCHGVSIACSPYSPFD